MAKRNFHEWLSKFHYSIADYSYYIDFKKVYKNVDAVKIELNILNSLIGSKNIEADFEKFSAYYINVSVWNPQNPYDNTSGIIKVLNEQNEDIVNDKNLTLTITNTELEDGKIIEKLKIVPLCKGEYELVITVTTKTPGESNGMYSFTESKRISVK